MFHKRFIVFIKYTAVYKIQALCTNLSEVRLFMSIIKTICMILFLIINLFKIGYIKGSYWKVNLYLFH